jgi:hypothetical protein
MDVIPVGRHDVPMTWMAPEVIRGDGSLVAGEREILLGYLNFQRSTLLMKCTGLSGDELAQRAAPPSSVSLLGLIRHMAKVERTWFRLRFVYLHMIGEYARHNGHADMVRERIDGATGF